MQTNLVEVMNVPTVENATVQTNEKEQINNVPATENNASKITENEIAMQRIVAAENVGKLSNDDENEIAMLENEVKTANKRVDDLVNRRNKLNNAINDARKKVNALAKEKNSAHNGAIATAKALHKANDTDKAKAEKAHKAATEKAGKAEKAYNDALHKFNEAKRMYNETVESLEIAVKQASIATAKYNVAGQFTATNNALTSDDSVVSVQKSILDAISAHIDENGIKSFTLNSVSNGANSIPPRALMLVRYNAKTPLNSTVYVLNTRCKAIAIEYVFGKLVRLYAETQRIIANCEKICKAENNEALTDFINRQTKAIERTFNVNAIAVTNKNNAVIPKSVIGLANGGSLKDIFSAMKNHDALKSIIERTPTKQERYDKTVISINWANVNNIKDIDTLVNFAIKSLAISDDITNSVNATISAM